MALSWNEIKDRSVAFFKEWVDTFIEKAEAKPFLEAFFNVFGINRKSISNFEHRVNKLSEADGYIDFLFCMKISPTNVKVLISGLILITYFFIY